MFLTIRKHGNMFQNNNAVCQSQPLPVTSPPPGSRQVTEETWESNTLTSLICSEVIGLFWLSIAPSATMMMFSLFFRARF